MNEKLSRNLMLLNLHREIFLRMTRDSANAAWKRWQACATEENYLMYMAARTMYAVTNLSQQGRKPFRSDN